MKPWKTPGVLFVALLYVALAVCAPLLVRYAPTPDVAAFAVHVVKR
jgi:hypothetical protein